MSLAKAIEKIAMEMEFQCKVEREGQSLVEEGRNGKTIPPTTIAQYAYRLRLILLAAEDDVTEERLSMKQHKEALINHLTSSGPSTRKTILRVTGIPAGSLSELLREPEFESVNRGEWRLRGE